MAIKMRGVHCQAVTYTSPFNPSTNEWKIVTSDIICGGYKVIEGSGDKKPTCYFLSGVDSGGDTLLSRCNMSQADAVFMFSTAVVVGAVGAAGYVRMRRGG